MKARACGRNKQILLVAGQAMGQLAFLVALPILTRIYSPAELGRYQLALAIGMVVLPLATMRLEQVIPSTMGDAEARRLMRIATGSASIVGAVLLLASAWTWLRGESPAPFVAAILIMTAYAGMALDNAGMIRRGETRRLVVRNVLSGLTSAIAQVGLSLMWANAYSLAIGLFLGRLFAIGATRQWHRSPRATLDRAETAGEGGRRPADEPEMIRWNCRRGATAAGGALVAAGNAQVLRILTGFFQGPAAVGQVGIAQQTAAAPLALVSQGLAQYTQSELAPVVRSGEGDLRAAVRRQVLMVLPFAIAVAVGLSVFGPLLAGPVFGDEWEAAGTAIAILAVPSGLQLLTAPLMAVFIMLAMERIELRLQIGRLILIVVGVAAGSQFEGQAVMAAVTGFAIGNSIGYVLMLWTLFRTLAKAERRRS